MKFLHYLLSLLLLGALVPLEMRAQGNQPSPPAGKMTLDQLLEFALQNRPAVQQARLDEEIGEREIKANLAAWYPQIGLAGNVQHYLKMPVTLFPNEQGVPTPRTIGAQNTSNLIAEANQNIFSNEAFLASRTARFIRLADDQNTINTKINTVVTVSKAFYDVLFTQEQIRILDEAIVRQEKQLHDAKAQYEQGLVDKTDFQRASISLGNTRADRKRAAENLKARLAFLKQQTGIAPESPLELAYDQKQMETTLVEDTTAAVTFANRIEFQQLQTQKQLQGLSIAYFRWGFLPTVSAFANYNLNYQNNQFSELYSQSFPNSLVGLRLSMPIFQGTRRTQNLRRAQLLDKRLDLDLVNARNEISTEYETALANYKSDLNEWLITRENVTMAEDVYRIIKLQYDEGIKTYLEVITAETDLRTTQLNYFNALYRVQSSKLDLQRARGTVNITY